MKRGKATVFKRFLEQKLDQKSGGFLAVSFEEVHNYYTHSLFTDTFAIRTHFIFGPESSRFLPRFRYALTFNAGIFTASDFLKFLIYQLKKGFVTCERSHHPRRHLAVK